MRCRPLYAALAALIAGVLFAFFTDAAFLSDAAFYTLSVVSFLAGFAFLARKANGLPLFLVCIFCLGAGQTRRVTAPKGDDVSRWADGPSLWVRGVVVSELAPKPFHSVAFTVRVNTVNDYRTVSSATGDLSVFAPETDPPLRPGDTVWLRGLLSTAPGQTNPDGFNYQDFLARRGIWATLKVRRPADVRLAQTGENGLSGSQKAALWTREAVQKSLAAHLPPNDASLLGGLLLSLRGDLTGDMQEAFVRTGTVHILSVSGLHIAALAWLVQILLGKTGLGRRPVAVLTIVLIAFAALASGGSVAAVRSVACAAIVLAAPIFKRTAVDPLHSLGVAAFAIILFDSLVLFDAGAQLSFATVGFLMAFMPVVTRILFPVEPGQTQTKRLLDRYLLQALAVGMVAEIASAPLTLYHFNRASLIGPFANLFVVPLSELLVAGGMATVGLSFVLSDFATAPLWGLLHLGLRLLEGSVALFASVPHTSPSLESPPVWGLWAIYLILGGLAIYVRRALHKRIFFPSAFAPNADGVGDDSRVSASGRGLSAA